MHRLSGLDRKQVALWAAAWLLSASALASDTVAASSLPQHAARQVLLRAKAEAVTIPKQAEALARLAWPKEGAGDPLVQALARDELVHFGELGLPALRQAIKSAPELYKADATAALVRAYAQVTSGIPPDFLPALEDAIWSGAIEAQRVAIPQAARYHDPAIAALATDAVTAHPELRLVAIQSLGLTRDDRARFFLGESLVKGSPRERGLAAVALASIGGRGLDVLRESTRSDVREIRQAAIEALLPFTGLDDLTVLHEYVGLHPADDPAVLERSRQRAAYLESLLATQEGGEQFPGPSPDP